MSLENDDIKKIAHLARLKIADNEINDYTSSVIGILALIEKMKTVNTANIEPLLNPLEQIQRLRPDEFIENHQKNEFLDLAPVSARDLYLTPQVIE